MAKADAMYDTAKEKCDDLSGNAKDVCIKDAKVVYTKAKDDAKIAKLDEIVREVSNPRSAHYTDYWSLDQLATLTAAAPERLDAVRSWLEDVAGAEQIYGSKTGDVLKVRGI